jgi:hypothetical protein
MAESAGRVCAYAAEIARAQTTAPPARMESIMMFLSIGIPAGHNARRNVTEAQTGRNAEWS